MLVDAQSRDVTRLIDIGRVAGHPCMSALGVQKDLVIANLREGMMLWLPFAEPPRSVLLESRRGDELHRAVDLVWMGPCLLVCRMTKIEMCVARIPAASK
jgi:hypothetical protein